MLDRRRFILVTAASALLRDAHAQDAAYPRAERGTGLVFPRDYGAHPAFRTEWWYATGWLDAGGTPLGVQITFFRARLAAAEPSRSRFAPSQLVFAHAALARPQRGALVHAQDALRVGFGDAIAREGDTDVRLRRWRFARDAVSGAYHAQIAAPAFAIDLVLAPTQPVLLQGEAGWSQKSPDARSASYYYSQPHLDVRGTVVDDRTTLAVQGHAWLDHEWSSGYLDAHAAGWDWIGIDLDDGGALMAFRMRPKDATDPHSQRYAAATLRDARGRTRTFDADSVAFAPMRSWTSPRTRATYPVEMRVQVGERTFTLAPLFDDQELDSRLSTGVIYWEGAVELREDGRRIGRGYLELTGYAHPLTL